MLVKSPDGTESENTTGFVLIIWGQVSEKGFQLRKCSPLTVRTEGVSKISNQCNNQCSEQVQRTLDDGHLCSRHLLYGSFLALHGNTDEYQYYFPLGGKRYEWLPSCQREGRLSQLKELFSILSLPKCIFVHVKGCITWLNESSDSATPPLFFDAHWNKVEHTAHVTCGKYSKVFSTNERL